MQKFCFDKFVYKSHNINMFKIFNSIYKIITFPLTLLSIPFKIIDFIFKIFGLIVLLAVVYFFGWIPAFNDMVNNNIPAFGQFVSSIKKALGLVQDAQRALPSDQVKEGLDKVIQARDLLK
jgi:hypothetical protein